MRIDLYLSKNGYAESRQKAKGLLEDGLVTVNGKPITKASHEVTETDTVKVTGTGLRYVGRGGLKLEGALQAFSFDPMGMTAIDVGASTGGFTDCLLQNGVNRVYAVDAGTNQLHAKLRNDPRVISLENCNAKDLNSDIIPEKISLAVMDLSFISQTCVYSALTSILKEGAVLISLIKPQFEAGRKALNKNGLVKDRKIHEAVIINVLQAAADCSLYCQALTVSPITGGDGNIEYLAKFVYNSTAEEAIQPNQNEIHKIVFGANK